MHETGNHMIPTRKEECEQCNGEGFKGFTIFGNQKRCSRCRGKSWVQLARICPGCPECNRHQY
jgi:DnaJ-class molecular chaperone